MAEKRLKKNISFSEHERDIYEYLEKQGNASAYIKRLILNQMMIEQGLVVPRVVETSKPKETDADKQPKEPNMEVSQGTSTNIESNVTVVIQSQEGTGMQFSEEDKENIQLLPDL